jgi:hypothetical protein
MIVRRAADNCPLKFEFIQRPKAQTVLRIWITDARPL